MTDKKYFKYPNIPAADNIDVRETYKRALHFISKLQVCLRDLAAAHKGATNQ